MRTIWKYPVPIQDEVGFEAPGYERIVRVEAFSTLLFVWAVVDTDKPKRRVDLRVCGTGHMIPDAHSDWEFVQTTKDNVFVWHVWELKP